MKPIIIIPARMASTRLPNKPLADIAGKPMIVQVMNRALEADIAPVYIACDSQEIVDAVKFHGGKAILTDPDLPSGTDRIYQAFNKIENNNEFDIVINVQGDEPTLNPESIKKVLSAFSHDHVDIATLVTKITNDDEIKNPNIVKAVIAWDKIQSHGKALYFSRSNVPYGIGDIYQHIGLYAYRIGALKKFTSLTPSPLELCEKLEQLRALENSIHIEAVAIQDRPLGVDTYEDLIEARRILENK